MKKWKIRKLTLKTFLSNFFLNFRINFYKEYWFVETKLPQ